MLEKLLREDESKNIQNQDTVNVQKKHKIDYISYNE